MHGAADFLLPSGKPVKSRKDGVDTLELMYRLLYPIAL